MDMLKGVYFLWACFPNATCFLFRSEAETPQEKQEARKKANNQRER